jgi:hypothetical protein
MYMSRRVKVPISAARARLFQLADYLRQSGDDSVVVLEQRGDVEPVALVREARLDYLESRVRQIDGAPGRQRATLRGSLTTGLGAAALDAALRDIRKRWETQTSRVPPAEPRRTRRR